MLFFNKPINYNLIKIFFKFSCDVTNNQKQTAFNFNYLILIFV